MPLMMISKHFHHGATALLALLALAAVTAAPAGAAASSAPGAAFALSPAGSGGSIVLHASPGRVLHGAVLVRNVSGHVVTVILQRADIQNASNGNANYVTARLTATGRWVRLGSGRVRLAAHASRRVTYTVSVPSGAAGGSHYAGIVAINAADFATPATRASSKGRAFTFFRISRQAVPLTVRLPGRLLRALTLRSARVTVQPIGAGLVLGLQPGGDELIQAARVDLRVLRGARTIFSFAATLGQLFPGGALNFRIPWRGTPTAGAYHLIGTIRPQGVPTIHVDQTIQFTTGDSRQLTRQTPPAVQPPSSGLPPWLWAALIAAATALLALSTAVWKLSRQVRRPVEPVA